eukprot:6905186-Karenia_brevis.AAC.1
MGSSAAHPPCTGSGRPGRYCWTPLQGSRDAVPVVPAPSPAPFRGAPNPTRMGPPMAPRPQGRP